jgi:hypothetical protein
MRKALSFLLVLAGLATSARAEVRKWTSAADASKTFEGEYVESTGDNVTIKRKDGKVLKFDKSKLSQEDRDFIDKQAAEKAKEAEGKAAADKVKESPMAVALKNKLQKLDGKKFKKFDLLAEKAPEYYLLYWGASW